MDRYQQLKFLRFFLETYWNDPSLICWRVKEAALISQTEFLFPMLDIGCGDGLFLKTLERGKLLDKGLILGIDLRQEALEVSAKVDLYKSVIRADAAHLPFKSGMFNSVLSNCVLEHIQLLDQTLSEVSRVASKGSRLIFTVPDKSFGDNLLFVRIARLFCQNKAAEKHKVSMNSNLTLITCQDKEWWERKLQTFGFRIKYCEPYLSNSELYAWCLFYYAAGIKISRFYVVGILNYFVKHSGPFLARFLRRAVIYVLNILFNIFLTEKNPRGNALFIVAEKA